MAVYWGQTAGSYLQRDQLEVCCVTVMPIIHLAATSSSFTNISTNGVSQVWMKKGTKCSYTTDTVLKMVKGIVQYF